MTNKHLDLLYKELEFDIDVDSGYVYLDGDVEEATLTNIVSKIEFIRRIRKKQNHLNSYLTLVLNSYGGSVYDAIGIVDYIRYLCPEKINTLGIGKVMSAACLILASGTGTRMATENTYLMIHEISDLQEGKSSEIKISTEHLDDLQQKMTTLFASFTNKGKKFWEKKQSRDFYLTADKALEYGLIDKIIK